MNRSPVTPAEAVKAFGTRKPHVQTARPGRVRYRDEETGAEKTRDGFITAEEPLKEEHILSAVRLADGRVIAVTIDGKRHVTPV